MRYGLAEDRRRGKLGIEVKGIGIARHLSEPDHILAGDGAFERGGHAFAQILDGDGIVWHGHRFAGRSNAAEPVPGRLVNRLFAEP